MRSPLAHASAEGGPTTTGTGIRVKRLEASGESTLVERFPFVEEWRTRKGVDNGGSYVAIIWKIGISSTLIL
ncbi:hypothetical protein [Scytonema sp. NUACC26]|uniref:hypothetical protein n=1 Tax=Scytonema sp. NUACC26 TaxID=3140176 RepID=UPI0038B39C6A